MRLFFGLDPLPDDKRAIDDWRSRAASADGRPVPPGNFHLTLAFLGEVTERHLESLCDAVDALELPGGGVLTLDRVGYWPRPGIFWLGPSEPVPALATLAAALSRAGRAVGARLERRRFIPHVTLYRGCKRPPPAPAEAPQLACHYRGVTLFESRAGRHGPRYEPVAAWAGDTQP